MPLRLFLLAASFLAFMWLTGRALPWARGSFIRSQPEGTLLVDVLRGLTSARWLLSATGATAVVAVATDRRAFARTGLVWHRGAFRDLAFGAGFAAAAICAVALALQFTGQASFSLNPTPERHLFAVAAAVGVTMVIGVNEEFFFRGYPFYLLVEGLGRTGGILLVAALFGLAHLGAGGTLAGVVGTAAWGAFLCDARLRRGSLWFPIGFHWAGNFAEGVVFGMPTSGQSWSHPLLRYQPRGDPILTGGAFGPEAGLFMTAAALAALLAMRGWRATARRPMDV